MVIPGLGAWNDPSVPERLIDLTSPEAATLIGIRPVGSNDGILLAGLGDDPVVCLKLYRIDSATMAERLALVKPGRRVCSW